jgi:hypothetical protein
MNAQKVIIINICYIFIDRTRKKNYSFACTSIVRELSYKLVCEISHVCKRLYFVKRELKEVLKYKDIKKQI